MTDEQLNRRLVMIRKLAESLNGAGYSNEKCPTPSEACWDIRFLLNHVDGLQMRIDDISAKVIRLKQDNERLLAEVAALKAQLRLPQDYCLACGGNGGHEEMCNKAALKKEGE